MERQEGSGLRDVDQTRMPLPQHAVVPQPENPDGEQQQSRGEATAEAGVFMAVRQENICLSVRVYLENRKRPFPSGTRPRLL